MSWFFGKNSSLRQLHHFGPKNALLHLSIGSNDFLKILPSQRGQELHQNYFDSFSKKNLIQSNWSILGRKSMGCYNSGSAPTNFLKILNHESGKKVHENCNDFSEKIPLLGNCTILDPKMMLCHNSPSALRTF